VGIEPLEAEQWLKDLKREKGFANPTLGTYSATVLSPITDCCAYPGKVNGEEGTAVPFWVVQLLHNLNLFVRN
jgi:hypothetical protein